VSIHNTYFSLSRWWRSRKEMEQSLSSFGRALQCSLVQESAGATYTFKATRSNSCCVYGIPWPIVKK
jgi:hypothetical protein